jgi:acyl dehydratase
MTQTPVRRAPLRASELRVGQSWTETVVEDLTRTQIVMYAGASGDFEPIHHDEVYARHTGHRTIFAHGMLTMGMTARVVTDLVGDGRLIRYGGRLTAQVWPGDALTATTTVERVSEDEGVPTVDLAIVTTNQQGIVVFDGRATARVDP